MLTWYTVGNISSTNTTEFDKTAIIIESWVGVLLIVAGLLINILVLTALGKSSNEIFNKSVCLGFSNILVGCVLIGVSGLVIHIMTLICGYFNLPPSIGVCKVFFGLYLIGGGNRYAFMDTNAIIIFLLVRLKNKAKIWKISVAITVILWLLTSALALPVISENVIGVLFAQGIACFPYIQSGSSGYLFLALRIILLPVLSYIIVITVPILTLFYLKQHNVSGDRGPQKGLIKFTFFLIIGNTIYLVSQLGTIIESSDEYLDNIMNDEGKAVSILYYQATLSSISLFPTPIMIILYFKFVRCQICSMLKLTVCKGKMLKCVNPRI